MFFRLTVAAYVVTIEIAAIVYLAVASYAQAAFGVPVLEYGVGSYYLCIDGSNTKDA